MGGCRGEREREREREREKALFTRQAVSPNIIHTSLMIVAYCVYTTIAVDDNR